VCPLSLAPRAAVRYWEQTSRGAGGLPIPDRPDGDFSRGSLGIEGTPPSGPWVARMETLLARLGTRRGQTGDVPGASERRPDYGAEEMSLSNYD